MRQNQLICLISFYSVQFLRDKIAERDFRELSIIFEITSTSSRLNPFSFLEVFPRNSLRSEKSETTKLFHLISDHFVSPFLPYSLLLFHMIPCKKNYAMLKLFIIPRQVALRHFSFPNSVFCCCYLLQSPFLDIFCGKRTGAVQPVSPRIKYSPPSLFTLPPHPLLDSLSSSLLYFLSSSILPPTLLLPALSCRLLLFTSPQSCIPVLFYSFCSSLLLPCIPSPPQFLMSPTPAFHF